MARTRELVLRLPAHAEQRQSTSVFIMMETRKRAMRVWWLRVGNRRGQVSWCSASLRSREECPGPLFRFHTSTQQYLSSLFTDIIMCSRICTRTTQSSKDIAIMI